MGVEDRVFLKLAKKVGYPPAKEVSRLRAIQVERSKKGKPVTLFDLARVEEALTPKQQKSYDRWAAQIEAKEKAALVEEEESTPETVSAAASTSGVSEASGSESATLQPLRVTRSGRIIAPSAIEFAEQDEDAKADLDELIRRFARVEPAIEAARPLDKKADEKKPDDKKADEKKKPEASESEAPASASQSSAPPSESRSEVSAVVAASASDASASASQSQSQSQSQSGDDSARTAAASDASASDAGSTSDEKVDDSKARRPIGRASASRAAVKGRSAGAHRATGGGGRGDGPPDPKAALVVAVGVCLFAIIFVIATSGKAPADPDRDTAKAKPPAPSASGSQDDTPEVRKLPRSFKDFDDPVDQKRQARALIAEARALLDQGDTEGARLCLGEAKSLDPSADGIQDLERSLPPQKEERVEGPGPQTPDPTPTDKPAPGPTPATPDKPAPGPAPGEPGPKKPAAQDPPKAGGPVVERYDGGAVKARYTTDVRGKRTGEYLEYHENGKPKVRTRYQNGQLQGGYAEFYASGKPKKKAEYKKDLLHGRLIEWDAQGKLTIDAVYLDGKSIYPRSQQQIATMLAELDRSPVEEPKAPTDRKVEFAPMDAQTQARPLRRVRQFRWLCGVPWDVDLQFDYGEYSTAAARLLDLVGRLDHTPKKPAGCSDSLYEAGYKGTSHGNLFMGVSDLIQCIDGWIDDSDPSNIDRVGHRRWLLNPPMKRTAIGQYASKWTVIWAHDQARQDLVEPPIVQYPSPGFFPTSHIHADAAWSVSLSGRGFTEPTKETVKVTVQPCDEKMKRGPPAELNYFNVDNGGFGQPHCVIFRPKVPYRPGAGYWVDLKGVKDSDGKPVVIEYYVEFFAVPK